MFIFVIYILSSVAINAAQVDTGPQTFSEQSLFASENNHKQLVNKQFSFYIAPLQLSAQNEDNLRSDTNNRNNQQFGQQDLGYQQRMYSRYINLFPIEESQDQNREQLSENSFNQKNGSFYSQLQEGLKLINFKQKPREQNQFVNFQQGSRLQKELLKSDNQKQRNLGEDLQLKWSRILGNGRVNLKLLSPYSSNQFSKVQPEITITKAESSNKENGNVIEYLLRNQDLFKQNIFSRQEPNSQNIPFYNQRRNILDKNLKALSPISENNQFLNLAQPESNYNEGQKNNEVRQQIDNIRYGNTGFRKQNGLETERQLNFQDSPVFNQQRYRLLDNLVELKSKNREQGNAELRKLIEDIVLNRSNNNFGEQNRFRSEKSNFQGISLNREQLQQERPLYNNKIHLKALSIIPEDNLFSEDYFRNGS